MAETIVDEGKLKCRGTITKGGLAGKECRRAILIKDPVLGWGIPCDRCPEFHPLRKILRDLVESGELDKEEVLAAISNKKNLEEKMGKDLEIRLPRGIGKNPKKAFELVSKLESAKEEVFNRLLKEYFIRLFRRGGRCYNASMCGEVSEIFSIGYRKPLKVNLKVFDAGPYYRSEFTIQGEAFWGDPEKEKDLPSYNRSESEKFEWISIYDEEDAVAYAQQAKKFFTDLGIEVSLKIEL